MALLPVRLETGSSAHLGARWTGRSAIAACALAVPVLVPTLQLHLVWEAAAWAVAALGLNLAVGFAGQVSLGHAAFVGVGAYTAVILAADHGWPLLAALPAAGLVAFVLGLVIGVPALRFRGLHLAFLTLAVGSAFGPVVKRLRWLTNGSDGKVAAVRVAPPAWFGRTREADRVWLYVVVALAALVLFVLVANMLGGRVGRALHAMRHDELAAVAFGVDARGLRVLMFGLSAGLGGLGGALLMLPSPFAVEHVYSPTLSFELYAAVFLGGIGSLWGCALAGAVIVALPFSVHWFGIYIEPTLVYGAALVLVTLFLPDGLMGSWRRARARLVIVVPSPPSPPSPER